VYLCKILPLCLFLVNICRVSLLYFIDRYGRSSHQFKCVVLSNQKKFSGQIFIDNFSIVKQLEIQDERLDWVTQADFEAEFLSQRSVFLKYSKFVLLSLTTCSCTVSLRSFPCAQYNFCVATKKQFWDSCSLHYKVINARVIATSQQKASSHNSNAAITIISSCLATADWDNYDNLLCKSWLEKVFKEMESIH